MRPLDAAEAGLAPRLLAGWRAAQAVLADGDWHGHAELLGAVTATGLTARTAANLLVDARRTPSRVETNGRRGNHRTYRLRPTHPQEHP
jgi:hypothetical protein